MYDNLISLSSQPSLHFLWWDQSEPLLQYLLELGKPLSVIADKLMTGRNEIIV